MPLLPETTEPIFSSLVSLLHPIVHSNLNPAVQSVRTTVGFPPKPGDPPPAEIMTPVTVHTNAAHAPSSQATDMIKARTEIPLTADEVPIQENVPPHQKPPPIKCRTSSLPSSEQWTHILNGKHSVNNSTLAYDPRPLHLVPPRPKPSCTTLSTTV